MYSASLRRPGGHVVESTPEGREVTTDTFKCVHCQRIVEIVPGKPVTWDFCRSCMAPICHVCAGKPCDHFEKKLDRAEARGRLLRDMSL